MGIPVRRCLACRRRTERDVLLRLVVADGTVVVDPLARRPGRGAYVCRQSACLDAALARGGAAVRSALHVRHGQVTVDEAAVRNAAAERVIAAQAAQE